VSKSVKFYYCDFGSSIFFIENNKVYFIWQDGIVRLSHFPLWKVERTSYFEFIEEVFN